MQLTKSLNEQKKKKKTTFAAVKRSWPALGEIEEYRLNWLDWLIDRSIDWFIDWSIDLNSTTKVLGLYLKSGQLVTHR
jgi:hypothetical protein